MSSKLKITEYVGGTGGFTQGLELSGEFRVKNTFNLTEINKIAYENTHKNGFIFRNNLEIADFDLDFGDILVFNVKNQDDIDFFIENFDKFEESDPLCIIFLAKPRFIIGLTSPEAVIRVDERPTTNKIAVFLTKRGYSVYQNTFNQADFGVPQQKFVNLTIATHFTPENAHSLSKAILNRSLLKDITVDMALSDLECDNKYRNICNGFQEFCRDLPPHEPLSWQVPRKLRSNIQEKLNMDLSQFAGYNRMPANKPAPLFYQDYMSVSSNGYSIHPYENRPLTVREACRLFGLTDSTTFDARMSMKNIFDCIYHSFSPLFGVAVGGVLSETLK